MTTNRIAFDLDFDLTMAHIEVDNMAAVEKLYAEAAEKLGYEAVFTRGDERIFGEVKAEWGDDWEAMNGASQSIHDEVSEAQILEAGRSGSFDHYTDITIETLAADLAVDVADLHAIYESDQSGSFDHYTNTGMLDADEIETLTDAVADLGGADAWAL